MKILIIRFSSIGDIILTTPVVRCLQQQTGAEIHYITKQSFATLLVANPYISKVIGVDTSQKAALKATIPQLQKETYDYVLDLHKNWRSASIRRHLKAPAAVFDKLTWQKFLLTQFHINKMPDLHIVDRYMAAAQCFFDIKNDGLGLDHFIPPSEYLPCQEADKQLVTQQYICLVVGAAHFTKRIPVHKLAEICNQTTQTVVLIGGKSEIKLGEAVKNDTTNLNVINLCGKLNLHQSAAIIDQSNLVIAPDTGMMHIAAALQKKVISVWGSTTPNLGVFPYLPATAPTPVVIENTSLKCRPCHKYGKKACPKGHFKCMLDLNVAEVIDAGNL